MSFVTKYECEFTDDLGVDWKVEIQEDAFAGTKTILQASGDPLFIEYMGDDDILENNIMGSEMSLTIECTTDSEYAPLFTADDFQYKVIVTHGVVNYWNGYILANSFQEPYDGVPYSVTLTASDTLGLLKNYEFKDLNYTSRQTIAKVIHDMLDLVEIDTFTEYVNIYESTMDDTTGDSAILQCSLDPELFKEANCYEALTEILKSLNAGIRQDNGAIEIFRIKELSDVIMYGRAFTTATANSAVTKTPAQKIDRPGDASNLSDMNGGTKMIIAQYKTVNVNHDFGFYGSILKNHNFPLSEYDSNHDIPGWTKSASTIVYPISYSMQSSDPNGMLIADQSATHDHWVYQERSVNESTADYVVEIEAGAYGPDAAAQVDIEIECDDGVDTQKYTYDFATGVGSWEETTDPTYITILNDTFSANLTWQVVRFPIEGIPYSGQLTVKLYNAIAGTVTAAYKSIAIYCVDSAGLAPLGIAYRISNAVNGQTVDREFILGDGNAFDQDTYQYKGSLNISTSGILATSCSWHTRGNTENIPLIQLIGQEYAEQYERQKELIDLPLREKTAATFLKINANLQDSYNQYLPGLNRIFAITRALYDIRRREYQLSLTEIIQ